MLATAIHDEFSPTSESQHGCCPGGHDRRPRDRSSGIAYHASVCRRYAKSPETRKHLQALVWKFLQGAALAEGSFVVDLLRPHLGS